MGEYNGVDRYVGARRLQQMQDHFSQAVGIAAIILDRDGNEITEASAGKDATPKQSKIKNAFWKSKIVVEIRKKAEAGLSPSWGWLGKDAIAAVVPMLLDEEYLGCWVFAKLVNANTHAKEQDQQHGERPEIEHIIGALASWDEIAGKLLLRTKRLDRTILGLDDRNKQLQTFVDASETAMYVCDFNTGALLMVNQAFCRQEGIDVDMVLGEKCWKVTKNSKKGFCEFCPRNKLVDKEDSPTGVYVWEHYNPRLGKWHRVTNKAIHWKEDRLAHMVTLVDITKERQLRDSLSYTAYFDRRTGLANTEKLLVDLREKQIDLSTDSIYLVCLQLKSMSQFSRGYGKANGYSLHAVMGEWLSGLDDSLSVYRTEGYGFILLLTNHSLKDCKDLVRKIRVRYREAWQLDIEGNTVFHYCSISGAIICLNNFFFHQDINDLVERTLQNAVETKEFIIYDENIDQQEKERVEFEIALKNQVRNGMSGFDVHYQPIVDAASGTWRGVEALCRWTDSRTGEAVSPARFIPEAERLGLIGEIGEWVLEQGVVLCKELKLDEIDGFFLSVNMSFGQIMDEGFAERVAYVLAVHQFPPEKLNLEVTESMEFHFNSYTLATIDRFKKLGINLALDDFGTGYSSLNLLKNLPAQYLKTERDFVADIESDVHRQYFYYMISELAHMNGMKLIAEGVETETQLELVRKNGADLIQGYFFSKPMPKEQLGDCVMKFRMPQPGSELARLSQKDLRKWQKRNTIQMVPPQLFHLMSQCIELLFAHKDTDRFITSVAELAGKHFGVNGAFVYLYETPTMEARTAEWVADPTNGNRGHLTKQAMETAAPFLRETFIECGALISSDITLLPPAVFDLLEPTGLRSILVLPIKQDEAVVGIVGFEDSGHRGWDQNEMLMLWNLSCMVRGCWEQAEVTHDLSRKSQILSNILHATGVNIMICDIDTSEILWVNESSGSGVLKRDMVGKRCCEVIQGRPERCDFCQVPKLIAAGPGELLCRDYYSERFGKTFTVYDGLLRWENNRLAHIEYFIDSGKKDKAAG